MTQSVVFLSHGGPQALLNGMENKTREAWRRLGASWRAKQPLPRAIVCVSAHWLCFPSNQQSIVQINASPKIIYDYGKLYSTDYDIKYTAARPDSGLLQEVINVLREHMKPFGDSVVVRPDAVERGLDHGCWTPLLDLWPNEAGIDPIPIILVQLPDITQRGAAQPDMFEAPFILGRILQNLRDRNMLLLCSGGAIHNLEIALRSMFSESPKKAPVVKWARDFHADLDAVLQKPTLEERYKALSEFAKHKDMDRAHPSVEHLLPLAVAIGASRDSDQLKSTTLWSERAESFSMSFFVFESS